MQHLIFKLEVVVEFIILAQEAEYVSYWASDRRSLQNVVGLNQSVSTLNSAHIQLSASRSWRRPIVP